jgi:RNA 2',3'-cyclic 3'-phosphodiesterase
VIGDSKNPDTYHPPPVTYNGFMTDILRLFIALPLPSEVKDALQTQQDHLKTQLPQYDKDIRWTIPEQWHLTLAFLGATNRERLPQIQTATERAAKNITAFVLETTSLGAFPSLRRPSVVWLGVGGDVATLQTLQLKLSEALRGLLEPDDKPFKAHLTLARLKQFGLGKEVSEAFSTAPVAKQVWAVNELCLYQSTLKADSTEYKTVHRVALQARVDSSTEKN